MNTKLSDPEHPKDIEGVTVHGFIKKHKHTLLIIAGIALLAVVFYFATRQKPVK
jgi:hypothetical protein